MPCPRCNTRAGVVCLPHCSLKAFRALEGLVLGLPCLLLQPLPLSCLLLGCNLLLDASCATRKTDTNKAGLNGSLHSWRHERHAGYNDQDRHHSKPREARQLSDLL